MNSITKFYNNQVVPRFNEVTSIPRDLLEGAFNLITGAFFQTTGLITLGQVKVLKDSKHRLSSGAGVASTVFARVVKTINPKAEGLDGKWDNPLSKVMTALDGWRRNAAANGSFVAKRVYVAAMIPTCVIGTALDVIAGAAAVPLSILCLGTSKTFNQQAAAALKAPQVVPAVINKVRYLIAGEF